MQLPQFIARMLGFADNVEKNLTAIKDLETANAKIQTLEGALAASKATDEATASSLKTLNAKITQLEATITAKDGEIAKLQAEVAAEKKRANDTLASLGVSAENLPAASTGDAGGAQQETAWQKYQRLLAENPRAAGAFWAEKSNDIIASRK